MSSETAPSLEQLDEYVGQRMLTRRDQGPLSIYNYTNACTYARAWTPVTLQARGLILNRETGEVVARPFPKFFNLGEHGIVDQHVPDAPPDAVTVKHDGSLGILYREPETARLRWTTRGMFDSPQARAAERIWAKRHPDAAPLVSDAWTLLVEIIAPETANIVRYQSRALILLGVRDRFTGADLPDADVRAIGARLDLPVTERVEGSVAEIAARAASMTHKEEGFVVRWGAYRLKIKSADYLRVARIVTGLNERRIGDAWYAERFELAAAIPEEFRGVVDETFARLDRVLAQVTTEFAATWKRHGEIADRKEFVDRIGIASPIFAAMMERFDGKPPNLRRVAYREVFGERPRAWDEAPA